MDGGGGLHIVVFPWLAFGHMIPYLELSKSLAKKGHTISFLSTPRNIDRLPQIPPNLSPLINFVKLPLPPAGDDLPENAEATSDLLPDKVHYLKKAFDGLEGAFARYLREASTPNPDWIIHDFSHHWVQRHASRFEVPTAFFSVFTAAFLAFIGPPSELTNISEPTRTSPEHFTVQPEWITFPSKVAYRLHEARKIVESFRGDNASGVSDSYRLGSVLQGCQVVAVRSCVEFESDWLDLLPEIYGKKPVIPVGLLAPSVQEICTDVVDGGGGGKIFFEWLDNQTPGSVVYVAFGSEATLSVELLHELALGLELSKLPFLWALRKPVGLSDRAEILPDGFEDRTRDRGLVSMGWVPQLKVLAHESVGGFLTHSGWSSIIESGQFGHPLILLPIFADQGLNARVMEESKIGIELERDEEDGTFTREAVANALRLVMVEEEGEPFRDKAREMMREVFGDTERHERYVDGFARYLKDHRGQQLRSITPPS